MTTKVFFFNNLELRKQVLHIAEEELDEEGLELKQDYLALTNSYSDSLEMLKAKSKAALRLLEKGWYTPAAEVEQDDLSEIGALMTSINVRWFLFPPNGVKPLEGGDRSIASYDLIDIPDLGVFMKMPLGYVDTRKQRFTGDSVGNMNVR